MSGVLFLNPTTLYFMYLFLYQWKDVLPFSSGHFAIVGKNKCYLHSGWSRGQANTWVGVKEHNSPSRESRQNNCFSRSLSDVAGLPKFASELSEECCFLSTI